MVKGGRGATTLPTETERRVWLGKCRKAGGLSAMSEAESPRGRREVQGRPKFRRPLRGPIQTSPRSSCYASGAIGFVLRTQCGRDRPRSRHQVAPNFRDSYNKGNRRARQRGNYEL